jgi:hypothetical protein
VVNLKDGHMATAAKFVEEETAHSGHNVIRDKLLKVERSMAEFISPAQVKLSVMK